MKLIALLAVSFALASAALAADAAKKEMGIAQIKGTAEGSPISGTAKFEDVKGGLKVTVSLTGVTGEKHALHIHEFGDCSDAGKAAGSHYNPDNKPHGDALKDAKHAHPGDFGNVEVKNGSVVLEAVLPKASLNSGKHPVAGRAIVLHEKADDFSQPVGNAGARVACGVITIVGGK
jgi:Cu-Zn family superoxide dismutase